LTDLSIQRMLPLKEEAAREEARRLQELNEKE